MKRGPKPIPQETKELRGNPGRRKGPEPEAGDLPAIPSWLPKAARPTWDAVIPALAGRVALHQIDSAALGDLVLCLFRLNQAERHIEKHGLLVKGAKGNEVKNPAAQLARSYRISVQRWFTNFGLTPADRSRVPGSTAVKTLSPLEAAREQLKQPTSASVQ